MPSYLTFYPGCVTPDSAASIDQALGTAWENTHPVLFTLLVTPFMRFGSAVGNLTLGVALFSLFQMLLLAGILAYGLTWLRRKRIRKVGICFVGLYFIVSQVFPLYAISMWKDVLFGAVVLLLTLVPLRYLGIERRRASSCKRASQICHPVPAHLLHAE